MHCIPKLATATTVACSLASAIGMSLLPAVASGQIKPNVTVVNPASNPVNTRITNAVVPVEISNADAIPIVAQESEGGRQIYNKTVTLAMGNGAGNCNSNDPVTVPAGKRLVVEYLSAVAVLLDPVVLVSIALRVPNGKFIAVVPAGKTATGNSGAGDILHSSAAGQYVHVYSDTNLLACAVVSNPSTQDFEVNISGYLVDKP